MFNAVLLSGNANPTLAAKVAAELGCELGHTQISRFDDSETSVEIFAKVCNKLVLILQPTSAPCDKHIIELCLLADAARRSGAKSVHAIIPYFGYSRQDLNAQQTQAISANVIAEILQSAGIAQIISLDLHTPQLTGFFKIPVINIGIADIFASAIQELNLRTPIIVAPDFGSMQRARSIAQRLNIADLAVLIKERNCVSKAKLLGNVKGRNCIIVDDIIASGQTICQATASLKMHGALQIYAYCTHGVFTKDCLNKISKSALSKLIVSDSIELTSKIIPFSKVEQLSVASVIAASICKYYKLQIPATANVLRTFLAGMTYLN